MRVKWMTFNVLFIKMFHLSPPVCWCTVMIWMLLNKSPPDEYNIYYRQNATRLIFVIAQTFRRVWMEFLSFLFLYTQNDGMCACSSFFLRRLEFLDEVITKNKDRNRLQMLKFRISEVKLYRDITCAAYRCITCAHVQSSKYYFFWSMSIANGMLVISIGTRTSLLYGEKIQMNGIQLTLW